jgi:hypothetical protein
VPKICFGCWYFQRTWIAVGFSKCFLLVLEIHHGELVGCSIDKLFTIGIKTVSFIVPKTALPVPKTMPIRLIGLLTPTQYTRMCFPPDLARTGDFTPGQAGFPTAPNRAAAGYAAQDGQPLPGASPPLSGNEAPTWGQSQHPLTAGKGDSLPAVLAF